MFRNLFMGNKAEGRRGFAPIIIVAIAAALLVIGGGVYLFRRPAAPPELATFRGSHVAGFEGDFVEASYELRYSKDEFSIEPAPGVPYPEPPKILLHERDGRREHSIDFFYNGDAAFTSSADLWENHVKADCPACRSVATGFIPRKGEDVAAYADEKSEWIIYRPSGSIFYLIGSFAKPSRAALGVLATLDFSTRPTSTPPELGGPLPPPPAKPCVVTGCSGELCLPAEQSDLATICLYKEE